VIPVVEEEEVVAFTNTYSVDSDGVDDYIISAYDAFANIGTGDLTIHMRFKIIQATANSDYFFYIGQDSSFTKHISARWSASGSTFTLVTNAGSGNAFTNGAAMSNDTWYTVTLTRTGSTIKVFRDGDTGSPDINDTNTKHASPLGATGDSAVYLGNAGPLGGNLNIRFHEFAIYNTVLSDAAIGSLYNSGVSFDLRETNGSYDPGSNLKLYLPLNEGTGTVATDLISASNGTLTNGPTWSSDVPEAVITNTYSIDLNGTNQYMAANALASVVSSDNVGTFSAWVAPTDASPNTAETIMGFGDANADSKLEIHISGITQTLVRASCSITGTIQWVLSSSDLGWTNGVWHHVAVTHDGSTAKIYIDGVDISAGYTVTTDITAWLTDITGIDTFCVGATNKNSAVTQYFDGLIDEAAYFSTALSAAQITAIYNSGVPANLDSYSPVGWYRMGDNDGGTGTTITDQGSGGNDGTLINAPTFSTNVPT